MKKLLKSEICGSVNSARDSHMVENWLKSQTFWLKKKKRGRNANVRLGSTKRASQMYPKAQLNLKNLSPLV